MKRVKKNTFSSAREIFKTYLPKKSQDEMNNDYVQAEDKRTTKLLEVFKSRLAKQTPR
jgi:hypothetical protein